MKKSKAPQKFSFHSRLERLSPGVNYFGLSVPLKTTRALGTRGPVPVTAQVNDSRPFRISLFPVGGGRHYLRVKAEIRKMTQIKEGDRVRVQITVLDRSIEAAIPKDLMKALRAVGKLVPFQALPIGKRCYLIRWIGEAAKAQTREKRIQATIKTLQSKHSGERKR